MAEYFKYITTYNNTLVDRSNSSFSPVPPYGEVYSSYYIVPSQPLYYYRESGGNIILNDQTTIDAYLESISVPDPKESISLNEFTGYTETTAPSQYVNVTGDTITGELNVSGRTEVAGSTYLDNTLNVTGATKLGNTLEVIGNTTLDSTLNVSGRTEIGGSTYLDNTLNISGQTTVGQNVRFIGYSWSGSSQSGDLWWQSPRLFFRDGTTNRDILQGSLQGTTFPTSPADGDLFYRISGTTDNNGILYVYDVSRSKYLSVSRPLIHFSRDYAAKAVSAYFGIQPVLSTATKGFYLVRNGTILSFSYDNDTLTTANMSIQIRINNGVVYTGTVAAGQKSFYYKNLNVNFNEGDRMQVYKLANGSNGIQFALVLVEIAWRP